MYVSIRDATVRAAGFGDLGEGLRHFGLDGIELQVGRDFRVPALAPAPERPHLFLSDDGDVDRLAAQMRETGIRVWGFLLPSDFSTPDQATEIAWHVRVVEVAARLQVPVVRIDAILRAKQDLPIEEYAAFFAESVRRVLDETNGRAVDLGIENHGAKGNTRAFLDALLASIDSPRLGLTLDSGNFYWSGMPLDEVYQTIEHFAPAAKHTHVKNIRYPEELRQVRRAVGYEYKQYVSPIPEGDIDHARFVAALRAAGYDRDLCIEDESLGKYDQATRRLHIQAAADHLRGLL
jgi:sugar phosphate isomerase/epimerase